MNKYYSKELLLSPELIYSFDEASNCLVFISFYGKFTFSMYQNNCILTKKGQQLKILYKLSEKSLVKGKNLSKIKAKLGSFFVFLRQLISRLNFPAYSTLSLIGTGYRANVIITDLELNLGHSNKIRVACPNAIRIFVRKSQRQHSISFFSSSLFDSKNLAAKIIKYRPVSPYTGKGLLWHGARILRKEGKGQFKR
jgi:large subunit ribosomal protein L6